VDSGADLVCSEDFRRSVLFLVGTSDVPSVSLRSAYAFGMEGIPAVLAFMGGLDLGFPSRNGVVAEMMNPMVLSPDMRKRS